MFAGWQHCRSSLMFEELVAKHEGLTVWQRGQSGWEEERLTLFKLHMFWLYKLQQQKVVFGVRF